MPSYITAELVERIEVLSDEMAVCLAFYYIGAVAGIPVFEYLGKPAESVWQRCGMIRQRKTLVTSEESKSCLKASYW